MVHYCTHISRQQTILRSITAGIQGYAKTHATGVHCKPKPCIAHRKLPVSQFPQEKTCFHYRGPLFSLEGPCFHYRDFPVNPCTSLLLTVLGIAVFLAPKQALSSHPRQQMV